MKTAIIEPSLYNVKKEEKIMIENYGSGIGEKERTVKKEFQHQRVEHLLLL